MRKDKTSPSEILKLIRDGKVQHLVDLHNYVFYSSGPLQSMFNSLKRLSKAGLISLADENIISSIEIIDRIRTSVMKERKPLPNIKISVADNLAEILSILEVRLSQIGKYRLSINPIFGIPYEREEFFSDVVVLMPFSDAMRPIYDDHIKKITNDLGLRCMRADDIFSINQVIKEIWSMIFNSKIVVADCTGRSPNIFYEIGIAHTLGKKTIIISQNEEDIPFDIKHIRYIKYSYTPRGMLQFEDIVRSTIQEILSSGED